VKVWEILYDGFRKRRVKRGRVAAEVGCVSGKGLAACRIIGANFYTERRKTREECECVDLWLC
jgi:hypothetical protein